MSDDPIKSVSHDGYEHVQEGDLRDECRATKDQVAEDKVCMVLEAVHSEITKHQQVLVERWVKDVYTEDRRDDVVLVACWVIQLQHEHGTAEVGQDDGNDQANGTDVCNRPLNQGHVKGGIVEQPEPVEHSFHSLADDDKNAEDSFVHLGSQTDIW